MKTFLAIAAALAIYVVLGIYVPITGHTALVLPGLQAVPAVGAWLCFLTYKGIASLVAMSALCSRMS